MSWNHHLRDNYEFGPDSGFGGWGGFVFDVELRALNLYGWAKHFKTRGSKEISLKWIKGYRLQEDDTLALLEGRQKPVPQCQ
jgi:hypothetical protein